ncbi:hypothetical protein AVEN_34916-1 [Araneus ventricosus]|uniref:Uncharacterized protein n=1 Tax=Araneus ventricosus TaxID=182803 RepID=A0A4Y2RZF9_ARAVE|nr:hypothetical protein AVEN_34916-1 [Araneus ventricosus]
MSRFTSRLPLYHQAPSCHFPHNFSFLPQARLPVSPSKTLKKQKPPPFNQPVGSLFSSKSPEVSSLSKLPHPHNSSGNRQETAHLPVNFHRQKNQKTRPSPHAEAVSHWTKFHLRKTRLTNDGPDSSLLELKWSKPSKLKQSQLV